MSTTAPSEIAVTPVGHASAMAWLVPNAAGVELTVVGKIVVALGLDGQVEMVAKPELPGWHQARPAPAEVDREAARKMVARGRRMHAGKVVLRRGSSVLVECPFGPGDQPVETPLANNMQTTIAGRRGDEWLVVEGGDRPDARRWCKLPKLGLVATWNDVERMVLTSRICFVDVSDWTIAFVLRGARKILPAMAPRHISVALHDMAGGAPTPVRGPAVTGPPAPGRSPAVTGPPAFAPAPLVVAAPAPVMVAPPARASQPGGAPPPSPFAPRNSVKKVEPVIDDETTGIRLTDEDLWVTEAPATPLAKKKSAVATEPLPSPAARAAAPIEEPIEPQPATRIFSYEDAMKSAGLHPSPWEPAGLAPGLKEEATVFASDPIAMVPKVFNEPTPPPAPFKGPAPRRSSGSGLRLGRGSGVMPAVQEVAPSLDEAFDMLEGKTDPKK